MKVLQALDKADSEISLKKFIKLAWPILEPERPFVDGWHIDATCDHLEAVSKGEILRLLINIPPGFMKSLTVNVFWPAWEWGPRNKPDLRYINASYSEALTIRDNRRCRNLLKSAWYQALWGNRFQLVGDQNAKTRYDNDRTGFKIATSVGGLGTGERGDRFTVDDPHNVKDGESDLKREAGLLWFNEVVPTRMNDPIKSVIVVIMQRVHDRDISGQILAKKLGYTHLSIPLEYEAGNRCKTKYFVDPRKKDGELAWPERMPRDTVEREKKAMGAYAVAAQFQQRPAPRGGGMFKRDWFEIVDEAPKGAGVVRVRGWDLAATEKLSAAFTCGVRISKSKGTFYVEHVVRFRGTPRKVEATILKTAAQDSVNTPIDLPQDPGQSGKYQASYMISALAGYTVKASPESGSKEDRASPFASQAEAGNVKLVRGMWNEEYLEELCKFPYGEFKDQVDASSRAFARVVLKSRELPTPVAPQVVNINA